MKWIGAHIIVFLAIMLSAVLAVAEEPKPLFATETPIKIQIEAPFAKLTGKAEKSTDPYPAKLILQSDASPETHIITLAARGKSRRNKDNCRFPPLRVRFGNKESGNKPSQDSLFKGQKSIKLVTHCKSSGVNQQYMLMEYVAYRLLNVLTKDSLNVRLVEIDYVESGSGKLVISRSAFFIEDMDDAAERTGREELDVKSVKLSKLDTKAATRTALYQYMISNLDWSMTKGPPDSTSCCHNTKLMAASDNEKTGIIPVPYDFDQSGLVATNYARPPANIAAHTVKTRVYRGHCDLNPYVITEAQTYAAKQSELLSVVNNVPGLQSDQKSKASKYLGKFFETINDPKKLESRILKKCRK